MLRPLVILLAGEVNLPSHTICNGSKALGNSSLNNFFAIKSICPNYSIRKYIFYTL
jgi:hypothetical protein